MTSADSFEATDSDVDPEFRSYSPGMTGTELEDAGFSSLDEGEEEQEDDEGDNASNSSLDGFVVEEDEVEQPSHGSDSGQSTPRQPRYIQASLPSRRRHNRVIDSDSDEDEESEGLGHPQMTTVQTVESVMSGSLRHPCRV